ncbi:hypothetical protein [Streptomyces niveus]|uniref:hypothetical protein n=1 Tax=Streptomyces niveus TaxID=193462 RepID=UPI00386960DF
MSRLTGLHQQRHHRAARQRHHEPAANPRPLVSALYGLAEEVTMRYAVDHH